MQGPLHPEHDNIAGADSYQCERNKDDQLHEDKDVEREHVDHVQYILRQGFQVGCDKAHVGANKADLRDGNRP